MGHFCTRCGRPLEDGEVCNCQGQGGNAQQQVNLQKTPQENEQNIQVQQAAAGGAQTNMNQNVNPQTGAQQNMNQNVNPQAGAQQNMNQNVNPQTGAQQNRNQNFGQMGPQGYQPNANMQQQPSAQRVAIQNVASKFFETIIGMLRTPLTTGRALVQEADIVLIAVFLVLQGILSGLFGSIILAKTIGKAVKYFGGSSKTPYVQAFLATFFASIALSVILAVILYVIHMVLKKQVRFQEMLAFAAIRSAWIIPAVVISMILALMSVKVGLFCFYALEVFGFVAMITTLNSFAEAEKKDKMIIINGILIFVFLVCAVCVMAVVSKTYIPGDFGSDLSDLFGTSGYSRY